MKPILMTVIVAIAASGVSAQETALGSRISAPAEVASRYSPEEAVRGAHEFADCLVHRREEAAVRSLSATSAPEAEKAYQLLSRDARCLSMGEGKTEYEYAKRLTAPQAIMRGLLAEELIRQNYANADLPALPMQRDYRSAWTGIDGRDATTDDMAVCVAATDPSAIRALIATVPTSEAEHAAVVSLSPQLGRCLAANARLTGNRQSIRAALAEALYHRMSAPSAAGDTPVSSDRSAAR